MFPRIAVHTGNEVDRENRHPEWVGTTVLQHNETTATMLKYGEAMKRGDRKRKPPLSTFQSNCQAEYWKPFTGELLGQRVVDGKVVLPQVEEAAVEVSPVAAH